MDNIFFEYGDCRYSGYILNEAADAPRYFWLVFNEDEMIGLFGDTIAFEASEGKLLPVYEYTHKAVLVDYLRKKVEAVLISKGLITGTAPLKKAK